MQFIKPRCNFYVGDWVFILSTQAYTSSSQPASQKLSIRHLT